MRSLRRAADVPGLARLLADLPRERIAELTERWGSGSPVRPGIAAWLYHAMTDRERLASQVAELDGTTRLVLEKLAASPTGLNVLELGLRLPFADDSFARALAQLEELGLAWRLERVGRESDGTAIRWVVPRDLATRLIAATHQLRDLAATAARVPPVEDVAVRLVPTSIADSRICLGGKAREHLSELVSWPDQSKAIVSDTSPLGFATQAGAALGVLERRSSVVGLGPRAEPWSKLAPLEQTRALVRLWLVDDNLAGRVPPVVRAQLRRVLLTGKSGVWYEVGSLARVVAEQIAETVHPAGASQSSSVGDQPGYLVGRRQIVQAIATLHWIGVVDVATGERDAMRAIRITAIGAAALT